MVLLFYAAWWIFWALIQTLVSKRLGLRWDLAFIDSFVSNGLLAILCITAILLYQFYQPGSRNRIYRFIYAVGIALLFCVTLRWILSSLVPTETEYLEFVEKTMPLRFISGLLILSFVTLLNWMWSVLKEQKDQESRRNEAEQLVKEAELVKLRQQLQPHFLFNSLNSISALAGSKPEEARKMIQQLSDFLRGTLKKDEQQTVHLKEELEHLKLYLEIEKVRFGHRMNVEINIKQDALEAQIPPLLLQPIVENAIKFGLYGTTEEITVSISAIIEQSNLVIEIRNPFDPETQTTGKGTGFGLTSVQRRLFLLYTRNDLLALDKAETIFSTRLKIPQIK